MPRRPLGQLLDLQHAFQPSQPRQLLDVPAELVPHDRHRVQLRLGRVLEDARQQPRQARVAPQSRQLRLGGGVQRRRQVAAVALERDRDPAAAAGEALVDEAAVGAVLGADAAGDGPQRGPRRAVVADQQQRGAGRERLARAVGGGDDARRARGAGVDRPQHPQAVAGRVVVLEAARLGQVEPQADRLEVLLAAGGHEAALRGRFRGFFAA
ncbi:MAG: hypothetical protein ISN26_05365 [Betaproteobacteria bacterium AqS2]|uniref:Uncharacterized protein n=1 Tax=Candidatus Amphirhobacter heronislandensis TaxID=1732024 RepID=A0A930Y1L3_9GAMM|nr:hypothetical protein [Betaproteobacteria bacterium AqS2]